MSKLLQIDDMLEAAVHSNTPLPDADVFIERFERLATELGAALAKHFDIRVLYSGDWQGKAFGGLCVGFGPKTAGQECPQMIEEGDRGGDWELENMAGPPTT